MTQITVTPGKSDQDGACDTCDRHRHVWAPLHKVYTLNIGQFELRICDWCRQELIHALANANKPKARSTR